MKRLLKSILVASSVLSLSLVASAQNRGQGPYDNRNQQRVPYPDQGRYGNDPRYGGNQNSLIRQVLADLNMTASNARVDGHEAKHFNEAARALQDFENRAAQGKFDTGKLDKAIKNLQHLANADQLRGRDRDILARDEQNLRQFRSTRGYNSYRR
ncbi:MAG: hypothetical protein ABI811_10260 [Acidobacteriota bacterium]